MCSRIHWVISQCIVNVESLCGYKFICKFMCAVVYKSFQDIVLSVICFCVWSESLLPVVFFCVCVESLGSCLDC